MQDASAEFETAVETGEVTWVRPLLLVDWLDDGAAELTAAPGYTVDSFQRDSASTWGRPRPDGHGQAYVHVSG